MAAMTTSLTVFDSANNTRTYSLSGHTPAKPRVVVQKRKVSAAATGVSETSVKVVYGTEDSGGELLGARTSFEVIVRNPVNGISTDVDAALAVLRDIIAGDEFANSVATQEYMV